MIVFIAFASLFFSPKPASIHLLHSTCKMQRMEMKIRSTDVASVALRRDETRRNLRSIRIAVASRMTELFCELQQSRGYDDGDDRAPG